MVQINCGVAFRVISLRKRKIVDEINVQRREIIRIFFNFPLDNLFDSQPFFFILFNEINFSHNFKAKIIKIMSQIAINTSQNVNINFNIASVGDRMIAFFIDLLIKIAYGISVLYIFFTVLDLGYLLQGLDPWSIAAIYIMLLFPIVVYPVVLESLMEGQTPGKKVMKIRVVKIDGYQAGFGDYLIRWVFRIIDTLFVGVVGLVSMIVSKNNQRLGDIASGTAVISLKNKINISHTILENIREDYVPTFPQVIALSDNDMRIIKDNYLKALRIDDRQIIKKLSDKIKTILKLEVDPTKMTERQFIGVIIKDYNYYTGKDS